MQKLTNAEVAAVVALKNAGLETSSKEPWLLFLKKGESIAHFAYDPYDGLVVANGKGDFAEWQNVHVKVLAQSGMPEKFSFVLFVSSGEGHTIEGFRVGERKAVEPVYVLLVIGKGKKAVTATVIERTDGKPIHQLCAAYTPNSAWELQNLLSTVGFLAATTLSDIRLLMREGEAND